MGLISNSTTIFDAGALAAGIGSSMTLIKSITASNSSTVSFIDGSSNVVLDSTYKEYIFLFHDIHGDNAARLSFQANAVGGSGFNEAITSTATNAYHLENDGEASFRNSPSGHNQGNGTGFQKFTEDIDGDNDACMSGYLRLYEPSSTTFVKHFISEATIMQTTPGAYHSFHSGYINTTSAIDEIQFKMDSGNIDAGVITLYGIT